MSLAFPLGLESPGLRLTSTLANRSAERLLAIVAEHHLRGFGRYTPRDLDGAGPMGVSTFCNLFAQDVAEAMGVRLPRHMLANDLYRWLEADSAPHGWEACTAHVAQAMADQGAMSVVAWWAAAGPGHIAVLVPSLGEPGTWVAQAGAVRFTRGTVQSAFGSRPVTYWTHP